MMEWCFIVAVTKIRVDQEKRIQKKLNYPHLLDELWSAFDGLTSELTISFQRLNLLPLKSNFYFSGYKHVPPFILGIIFGIKPSKSI